MKPLSEKVATRREQHEIHAIHILNSSVKVHKERAMERFDWNGNEQITMKQTYSENKVQMLQKRLDMLYRYENEGPITPMVEEEKDLDEKQMSKIRKEREAEINKNQKTITNAHKILRKNPPDIPELTSEEVVDKLFVNPYTYETVHEFTPENIRDNFIESVKKLDEIIRIAKAVKAYPSLATAYMTIDEEEYELTLKYDFEEFAFACQKEFDNSLAANGLKYENGQLIKISYEETQEALANEQKCRQNVINVFKKADYLEEKNTVQSVVNEIIKEWSMDDYFKRVDDMPLNESLKQMYTAMQQNGTSTAEKLYNDYLCFLNSVMANGSAVEYLEREQQSPSEDGVFAQENYDFAGHIQDKIQELNKYISKTEKEMSFIKELFEAVVNNQELTTKQRMYLVEYYNVNDEELVSLYTDKLLGYRRIRNEYAMAPAYDDIFTLETNRNKIDELCPLLKSNMSTDDLLELADDLYKVSEAIKKRFDHYISTPSLRLKSQKIITYAQKARAVTLFFASGWYSDIEAGMTENEREYIRNTFGEINHENVAKYAKVSYAEADATYINARRECINRPEAWTRFAEIKNDVVLNTTSSHENINKELNETKGFFGEKEEELYNSFWAYYDIQPISEARESLITKSKHCQTLSRLGGDTYKIFGDEQEIPFNLETLKNLPGINNMDDEEYGDLLEKLGAGTFFVPPVKEIETDEKDEEFYRQLQAKTSYVPPSSLAALKAKDCFENNVLKDEVRERFINENKTGLQMIKNKMSEYLDGLYEKYGLEMPAMEQIVDNPHIIIRDFMYCRECFKFINCSAMFDETNDADMLLLNKIKFYGEMVNCFNKAVELSQKEGTYLGEIDFEINSMWDNNMKPVAEYIKENM